MEFQPCHHPFCAKIGQLFAAYFANVAILTQPPYQSARNRDLKGSRQFHQGQTSDLHDCYVDTGSGQKEPNMADILHQITIEAAPPEIYAALTTINGIKSWWTDACEMPDHEGGQCKFWFDQKATCFTMTAKRLLPHQRVFWLCTDGPKEWIGTELWWEITPIGQNQCRVDFKHMNWVSDEGMFPLCNSTWGGLMFRLKKSCENADFQEPLFVN